jgi:hypothetical protein
MELLEHVELVAARYGIIRAAPLFLIIPILVMIPILVYASTFHHIARSYIYLSMSILSASLLQLRYGACLDGNGTVFGAK